MLKRSFCVLGAITDGMIPRLVMQETRVVKARTDADATIARRSSLIYHIASFDSATVSTNVGMHSLSETTRRMLCNNYQATDMPQRASFSVQRNPEVDDISSGDNGTTSFPCSSAPVILSVSAALEPTSISVIKTPFIADPQLSARLDERTTSDPPGCVSDPTNAFVDAKSHFAYRTDIPNWLSQDLAVHRDRHKITTLLETADKRERQWRQLVELRDSEIRDLKEQLAVFYPLAQRCPTHK
jgi:hypothetical protein